ARQRAHGLGRRILVGFASNRPDVPLPSSKVLHRMRLLPAIGTTFLLAATTLPSQTDVPATRVEEKGGGGGAAGDGKGKGGKGAAQLEEKLTEIELAKLTPEERLARNVIHGAHGYCHFDVAVRPARLMPGQTGTVSVTMILEGDAVMPCPAKLSLLGA